MSTALSKNRSQGDDALQIKQCASSVGIQCLWKTQTGLSLADCIGAAMRLVSMPASNSVASS